MTSYQKHIFGFGFSPALALAIAGVALPASAHVALESGSAEAGGAYRAVLRVGHGCDGSPTTAIAVQLPAGFAEARPQPRPGWTLRQQDGEVRWSADNRQAALAADAKGEFVIAGRLPATPGPLWLKVRQTCAQGSVGWNQVPSTGTSVAGMKNPAPLLMVLAPVPVKVEAGWVRPSVPGQQGTGGYMQLTAREGQQLVAASSPVAGVAEVHEMKMDGDVMRMRAVGKLDLPAGKTVELKPGGLHLMLMDLKQPLTVGSNVPLSLVFRDQRGVESRVETRLLVSASAPGGAAPHEPHKH